MTDSVYQLDVSFPPRVARFKLPSSYYDGFLIIIIDTYLLLLSDKLYFNILLWELQYYVI